MNDINNNKINTTRSMTDTLLIWNNTNKFDINHLITFYIIPSNTSNYGILIRFRVTEIKNILIDD